MHELQNIYTARQLVFVLEQECPYLDADGVDEQDALTAVVDLFDRRFDEPD